ncbi:hypothetical protein RJ639_039121 [Escallonia herrerae]|uniref:Reverse transcriptase Ty1/copia-type domain-containing protein n=1 Tax=Escallonia herrerae TaxID=1293975 RepID=A0AA88WLH0_9ASTE|nr:hypothetical protein RJ639_039121 [Escallonia herrerae]
MEDESASYVHGGLAPVANVQNIAIDTKYPFYLHLSDHPGLIFVTQPLSENGENYFTWRRNMLTALQSKNKAGFVDGLIAKPDVHSGDFQSWIQCNAVVKSWIVNSLSRELQTGAAHADTASEIWCDFDERFTQGIALKVYDLKRSIALLQQEKSAISTYYGKLKGVWNELHNLRPIPVCTCGAGKKMQEMREEEKVFDFLMGLDDTYKTVRSQILSIDPLPGLGRAYAVAAQEEKQQVVAVERVPTIEATTLLAKAPHMRHGGDQKIDRRGENSGERRMTSDVPTRSNSPHNVDLEPLSLGSSSSQDQIPLDQAPRSAELSPSTIQSPIRTEQSALPVNEPPVVPSKHIRQVSKNLSGYNYTLPPSLAPPSSTLHSSSPFANSMVYHLSHNISYSKFSRTHTAFLAAISSVDEPKYFSQAVKHAYWRHVMAKEISALEANNTWTLMPLPYGKRAIDSKWVYKVKFHPDGTVERYKARLVAKGYTQIEGLDFHETFAPVAKLVTVRCLLAIPSIKKWELHQLDVNNTFFHGDLKEEVYMKIPQGFSKQGENRMCRLQKSLYGLRQASRNWYHEFSQSLLVVGFIQSQSDHSLFTFARKGSFLAVLIYVDDVIVTGTD